MTGSDALDQTRPLVEFLVNRERQRQGSKMSAYAAVGAIAGVSESWVRRLLGRRHVVVELQHFWNLAEAYRQSCERIEAERDLEQRRVIALRREADAVVKSHLELVVREAVADR